MSDAGNTLGSAQPISLVPVGRTFNDAIAFGDEDYYRFTLTSRSSVVVSLTGLTANADMQVLNSAGTVLADPLNGVPLSLTNTGTLPEFLTTILDPGTYYIRVFPGPASDAANAATTTPSTNYTLGALADPNIRTDILWRNYQTGNNAVWQMDGTNLANSISISFVNDPNWQIRGAADFNNDRNTDIVWRNVATGRNVVWFMNGNNITNVQDLDAVTDLNWQIQGVANFSQPNQLGIVWRNFATGRNAVWFMNGTTISSVDFVESVTDPNWEIQGIGDFNNDSNPDLVWRNQSTGTTAIWLLNGVAIANTVNLGTLDGLRRIQGVGDFDNDGQADLLWRNYRDGSNEVWLMDGVTQRSTVPITTVDDLNWRATVPFYRYLTPTTRDLAGNTVANPAVIGPLNGSGTYRDVISSTDTDDYYQFSLGSPTDLQLTLIGPNGASLAADLDVQLFRGNGGGTNITLSTAGTGGETTSLLLNSGNYYIRVFPPNPLAVEVPYELRLSVNNRPVLVSNNALTLSEGGQQTISNNLLLVTDENNTANQITYSLVGTPNVTLGALLLNNNAITTGSTFTQADINSGRLSYRQNGGESLSDNFVFRVSDGQGGTIGNSTFTVNVVPVNDPPSLVTLGGLNVTEGQSSSITSASLLVTDVEQGAAQIVYTLGAQPSSGTLLRSGVTLTTGSTFTQADITTGTLLNYRHNGSETTRDIFTFTVSDGAGGTLTPPVSTFSINVAPFNDPPVLITNASLTIGQDDARILTTTLLNATDAEFSTAALRDRIIYSVTTAPVNGTLFLSGTATNRFTQADLDNNRVSYDHNGSTTNSDSFTFTITDGQNVTTPAEFTIAITGSNFAPVLVTNAGLTLNEGAAQLIAPAQLLITDRDSAPSFLIYTLTSLPTNGTLKRFGTALSVGQTFTQADINESPTSRITYEHNGSETTNDSFSFTASDGTSSIGAQTFRVSVNPVNDAPVLVSNNGVTISEGDAVTISTSLLNATDVDNPAAQLTYLVATAPSSGTLLLNGTAVSRFTQADINSGQLRYQQNGSEAVSDSFSFNLSDGDPARPPIARSFNIAVIPVNDGPGISLNRALTLNEGGSSVINGTLLQVTDNDGPGPITYTLGSVPTRGQLQIGGVTLSANQTFTQSDLNGSRLSYIHDGSETTLDGFTFTASDGSTGRLTQTSFTINVNPVNDPPVVTAPSTIVLSEDGQLDFTGARIISVSDADAATQPLFVELRASNGTLTVTPGNGVSGNGTNTISLNGSQTTINSFLSSLVYRPSTNFSGLAEIFIRADDQGFTGSGGQQFTVRTIAVTVNAVNDAPTLTVPGRQTVLEDSLLDLAGLIIAADTDADTNPVRVDVTAPNGQLTVNTVTGISFGSGTVNGDSTLTLSGTITDIRNALGSLTYQGNPDFFGSDSITIRLNDQGNTGSPGPLTITRSISVSVLPVNDQPTFTAGSDLTVNEDAGAQTVNGWATNLFRGAANELSQSLSFAVQSNSNPTLFSLQPRIDSAGNLTYTPAANAFGSAVIEVVLRDNGGVTNGGVDTSDPTFFTITVNPVNDAPTFSLRGTTAPSSAEDAGPQVVSGWATGITTGALNETDQILTFEINNSNTTLFTENGQPTIDLETGDLIYTAAPNANGTAVVSVRLRDSGGTENGGVDTSSFRSFTINVTAVNDAPVLTIPSNAVTIDEDNTLNLTGISVTDIDAGTSPISVTLRVTNGVLNLGAAPGLTITNNNSANVSVAGTQENLNAALANLTYRGNENFSGNDRLAITASDNGATGSGAIGTDARTIDITVAAVNDGPTVTVPTGQTVEEDTILPLTGISVADPDADPNPVQITISATNGTLTFGSTTGLLPTGSTTNGSSTVAFIGSQADINAALSTLDYRGRLNFNGADTVTVTVNDLNNTGSGPALSDSRTISIGVTAVNDPPVVTVPAAQVVDEDRSLIFSNARPITITDIDSGSSELRVTLSVNSGNLTLSSTNGLRTISGSNGTSNFVFAGTLSNITTALRNLTYQGSANFSGADTLTITVDDQGNTGAGQPGVVTRTVDITVNAVNDAPVLLSNATLTLSEGSTRSITNSLLRTSDVDNTSTQLVYTLVSAPNSANGFLRRGATTLATGGTFTQADIDNGQLSFVQNGSENTRDSFVFRVSDGNIALPNARFSLVITPVNDRPSLVLNQPLALTEGGTGTIRTSLLSATDADNTSLQLLYTVTDLPDFGTLRLNSTPLSLNGVFTQADINNNRVTYRHNGSETTSDSFTFILSDTNGGTGGVRSFSLAISSVNDAPVLATLSPLTVSEGAPPRVITNSLLRVTDVDNLPSQLRYTLTSEPNGGVLLLNSTTTLGINSTFTQEQIDGGLISYRNFGDDTGTTDSFTFRVSDGATTLSNRRFDIVVQPVNDPPELVTNTGLIVAGDAPTTIVIDSNVLAVTDADNTPNQLTYRLTSVPNATVGVLRLNGTILGVGGTFTQADLDSGSLVYDYQGGGSSDAFQFTVSDGGVGGTLSDVFTIGFNYS